MRKFIYIKTLYDRVFIKGDKYARMYEVSIRNEHDRYIVAHYNLDLISFVCVSGVWRYKILSPISESDSRIINAICDVLELGAVCRYDRSHMLVEELRQSI